MSISPFNLLVTMLSKHRLTGLCLFSFLCAEAAFAQVSSQGGSTGTWQHRDGLSLARQNLGAVGTQSTVFLSDQGELSLTRSRSDRTINQRFSWVLGLAESRSRFVELGGDVQVDRQFGRHRLGLNLNLNGLAYSGGLLTSSLENQFILGNNQINPEVSRLGLRWSGELGLSDSVAITRSVSLNLNANHQVAETRLEELRQNRSEIVNMRLNLEQNLRLGSWLLSIQRSDLDFSGDFAIANVDDRSRQSIVSSEARFSLAVWSRYAVLVGWQDLATSRTGSTQTRRTGPELGLSFNPLASWSASILIRELYELDREAARGEFFGNAELSWRRDSANRFQFSLAKTIDLNTNYRIFRTANILINDEQRSTTSGRLAWLYQQGRQTYELNLSRARQVFTQSRNDYDQASLNYSFQPTRLGRLAFVLTWGILHFDSQLNATISDRTSQDIKVSYRQIIPGKISVFSGQNFLQFEANYEKFREEILPIEAQRLTLVASFGQNGNF